MCFSFGKIIFFFYSDVAKVKLKEHTDDTQIVELCKELVALASKPNKLGKNASFIKKNEEAKITLESFLKNFANDLKFFKIISRINRRKRYVDV